MVQLVYGLRIGTLNVRGLSACRKQCQLNYLLTENSVDVLAVQETKAESKSHTDHMVKQFMSQYNICVTYSVGKSGRCCLFSKQALGIVEEQVNTSEIGRLVLCDFRFPI